MEYRLLGRSGLKVSTLALGTMTFGGEGSFARVGNTAVPEARRLIDLCMDAGVNLIDTADVYSHGRSEEILGEAMIGKRDRLLIATKVRFRMGDGPNDAGLSRHHIVRACEASLKRLRTDYIDLYQLHQWDGLTPVEETLSALDDLVRSGKVRYVGVSNYSGWHLMKLLASAEANRLVRPVAQQIHYTLERREAEYELIPIAIDQGIGVLIWSPLAGGLLSGKFRRGQPAPSGTRHDETGGDPASRDMKKLYDIVEHLLDIASVRGISAAQAAIAWALGRPGVTSAIIGARSEAQLADSLKGATLELTQSERSRLDTASKMPLLYPYQHQAGFASDRLCQADLALLSSYLN
jgi:aryl-alcohol dehydrogenase-like predicted oxidoreductase